MNNILLQVKIKQRLNKLSSFDYDNLEPWQVIEAFNKVQLTWVRDQLGGTNQRREGDEQSRRRVDDLQKLLVSSHLAGTNQQLYFETLLLPENYLEFKRVSAIATHCDCPHPRSIRIVLAEEANADEYLRDTNTRPSWEWAESFCTLAGNRVRVYTGTHFSIEQVTLHYYRLPQYIQIAGVVNPNTGQVSIRDTPCEFKDDIAELLTDLTAAQLAADIESVLQLSRTKQEADSHN